VRKDEDEGLRSFLAAAWGLTALTCALLLLSIGLI
jgi:hypothetical protein